MSTLRVDSIRGQTAGTNRYVVQVLSTTKTDHFTTSSTSFTDITGLSLTITPSNSNNKVLIMTNVFASHGDAAILQALRDSTVIGSGDDSDSTSTKRGFAMVRESATNIGGHYSLIHLDSPNTTSATTYKIQLKSDSSGTIRINGRASNEEYAASSSITLMEIAQ